MSKNKLLLLLALLLTAATGAMAQDAVAIITTVRSWDFTKGGFRTDWASAQEAATSVWGGPDSSFRYSNANNLSEEELTDGTNPLKGLAGIYFTAPAGSLLLGGKDSSTRCLQTNGDGVSILLPDCAAKDRITLRFCASVNKTTVTITSDQMKSSYVANSTDRSNEVSAFVKENGNVVLNVPSKVRIYEIKIEPYVAVTNFNLSAETVTVAENNTVTVSATGFSPSNAFDKTLEWTTADENVATVANGVITGVNPGTTTITVTSVDGPSKTIGVTVLPTYSVTLAEGTKDADKWTISPAEAAEGATVTATYTGRLKVKGVKATSEAAPAEEPVPMEFVEFTNGTKKVKFANMNLGATSVADGTSSYGDYYAWAATEPFGTVSYTAYNAGTVTPTKEGGYSAANAPYRSGNTYSKYTSYGAILEAMDDAVTVKMGEGYRMPTMDDFSTLCAACGGTDEEIYISSIATGAAYAKGIYWVEGAETAVTVGGDEYKTNGVLFVQDADTHVFFPCAGFVNENNQFVYDGYYWSSTLITDTQANHYLDAHYMRLNQYYVGHGNQYCIDRQSGFPIRPVQEVPAAAKEPATVTTAPTGAAIVGVGKTTALVSGGVAEGGTLMYAVTTTNTKPASTDGFSDKVPTAETITASGKVYVWYYVKGDDTHSDSEIAATAIEVPVADIVWDATNVTDLNISGTNSYTKEGVTLSCKADMISAKWSGYGNPEKDGISFEAMESGGFTFTAPSGKKFTKIEMTLVGEAGWDDGNLGSDWAFAFVGEMICAVTWTGSAASTVDLLKDVDEFIGGEKAKYIAFYLSE